jgi:hypothetical protein
MAMPPIVMSAYTSHHQFPNPSSILSPPSFPAPDFADRQADQRDDNHGSASGIASVRMKLPRL